MDYYYKIYLLENIEITIKSVRNLEELLNLITNEDVAWIETKDVDGRTVIIRADKITVIKEIAKESNDSIKKLVLNK